MAKQRTMEGASSEEIARRLSHFERTWGADCSEAKVLREELRRRDEEAAAREGSGDDSEGRS